jgi:hypothetical protein
MAPVSSYISNIHRVPTYPEIIEQSILHPIDKIILPDRQATFIRNLPKITRFDEVDDPADIGQEHEKIQGEKLKEMTLRKLPPGDTLSLARSRATQGKATDDYTSGGTGPPPPFQPPRPQPPSRFGMIGRIGKYYASVWERANQQMPSIPVGGSYLAEKRERGEEEEPFRYFTIDFDAHRRAERELKAQIERQQVEELHYQARARERAHQQAQEALDSPSSVVHVPSNYMGGSSSSGAPAIPTGKKRPPLMFDMTPDVSPADTPLSQASTIPGDPYANVVSSPKPKPNSPPGKGPSSGYKFRSP